MKDRVRISLTLRPEIVELLDSKIDGTKIRNRSHAVEQFLRQALTKPAGQAIILIGDEEKTLTNICGETVLEKMLNRLDKAGIHKIILCCKTPSAKLRKFVEKKQFGEFQFIFTKNENKGTAAALLRCRPELDFEKFLFIYGDIIAEMDAYDLVDFHESHQRLGTIVVTSVADPLPWGVVKVKRNRVMDFYEKPHPSKTMNQRLTNLINAGIYVFQPEIFGYLSARARSLEEDILPKLIKDQQLYSYLLDGAWFNVSREDLLAHAMKYCTPKKRPVKV